MKRNLLILTLIVISLPVSAQNIDVGVGYGNSYFTAPEKYVNEVYNHGYGFSDSHPFTGTVFYSIPNKPVSLFASTVYQKLYGRGFLPIAFLDNSNLLPGEVENKSSLWSLSFGAELAFVKLHSSPFLSGEILLSKMENISITQGASNGNINKQTSGVVRSGIAVGGGFNLSVFNGIMIKINGKYNLYGLFSRPADEQSVNSVQLLGMITFPLYSITTEQQ